MFLYSPPPLRFPLWWGDLVMKSSLVTPWTVAHQAPLSTGFPGKNTGVGCHFLLQENLPDPGIEHGSPALQVDSLPTEPPGNPCSLLKIPN